MDDQKDKPTYPEVKRFTSPKRKQEVLEGIDLARAYRTLMHGFVDTHIRHHAATSDTAPLPQNLPKTQEVA